MKKSIFTLLVVALATPLLFNSCKGGGGDDPTPTPSDLPAPPKTADAIKVVINPPATQPVKAYPVSFEYTETGKAIVGFKNPTMLAGIPVKGEVSDVYYITGTGFKSGNVYTIKGPDGKTYKFEIIQSDSQVQIKYMDPDGSSRRSSRPASSLRICAVPGTSSRRASASLQKASMRLPSGPMQPAPLPAT